MRINEIISEAIIPQDFLAPRYFHGTKDYYNAQQILHYGLTPPDFVADGRLTNYSLRPVEGRIYLTPDAKYAGMYGKYIFVIYRENLIGDLLPDEDEIGEIYHWISQKDFMDAEKYRRVHHTNEDFLRRLDILRQPKYQQILTNFKNFMNSILPRTVKNNILQGEYDAWAKGGKKAVKTMPPNLINWLISIGVHVSHQGKIKPDEAWEIKKQGLLSDGSNLSEVAVPLKRDRKIKPHDRTAPVYEYEVTFSFEYPKGSKTRNKKMKFRAISREDAERKANYYIKNTTTPDANYKVIALEQIGSEPVYTPQPQD